MKDDLLTNVMNIVEFATEFAIAYQMYRLSHSLMLAIMSWICIEIAYATWTMCELGTFGIDDVKTKKMAAKLQPYWLIINTVIAITLSWL